MSGSSGARPDVRGARSLLFVCLGNICRSPLAQGVTEHLAEERGLRASLTIESCGTGAWHVGERPDPRAFAVAERNGVRLNSRARQLCTDDFTRFDLLLAMDRDNLANIVAAGGPPEKTHLFLAFAGEKSGGVLEVPDPYYGGHEGFDEVYRLIRAGAEGLLDAIQ